MSDQKQSGLSENSLGAVAYITFVPAIFFLAVAPYNRNSYVRFHAWQSILLTAVAFIISFALSLLLGSTSLPGFLVSLGLNGLLMILWFLVWLWCAIGALNGKRVKLPLIGAWCEQQANK